MPYKRIGKTVYVRKDGEWQVVKKHPNERAAQKHLVALKINVKEK
jgi:hypothetical protein